ncbi:MAG: molecular chaperone DnaJ, partial [Microbacteriaceae bacterium]|nr:molecular chaperone DnaJ [Microbacteriaceae bacterium]
LTLREVVFGAQRSMEIDTAVLCKNCNGNCCQPGTDLRICDVCRGSGQVQRQVRSLLGNVLTSAPCNACQGYGQTIANPCVDCRGQGRVRARRTLDLNIPGGVEDGLRLQMSGQGEVGQAGGPNGDIYVDISVRADEVFSRQGDDLVCTLEVPLHDAALGALIKVETFDGEEQLEIHPGHQTGEVITLKGKGVKHLRSNGRGDLLVKLQVLTPTKMDSKQKELLRQLQKLRKNDEPKLVKHKPGHFKARN